MIFRRINGHIVAINPRVKEGAKGVGTVAAGLGVGAATAVASSKMSIHADKFRGLGYKAEWASIKTPSTTRGIALMKSSERLMERGAKVGAMSRKFRIGGFGVAGALVTAGTNKILKEAGVKSETERGVASAGVGATATAAAFSLYQSRNAERKGFDLLKNVIKKTARFAVKTKFR